MSPDWADDFSFVRGAISNRGNALFAMVLDRLAERGEPHAVLQYRHVNGYWKPVAPLKWLVASVVSLGDDSDAFMAIGDLGQTAIWNGNSVVYGQIERQDGNVSSLGRIRCAANIDNRILAAGMGRTVVSFDGKTWTPIDAGMRRSDPTMGPMGFEAIAGCSENEVYAAGWHGELWQCSTAKWKKQDVPTNLILTALCCTSAGLIYAAGRQGLIVRGRQSFWEVINQKATKEDFWGAASFGAVGYFSTAKAVYKAEGESFSLVDFGSDLPKTCYSLAASDNHLLSIGPKDVMLLSNDNWQRLA